MTAKPEIETASHQPAMKPRRVATLLGIYMLPSTLALVRRHRNRSAVVALNVLAGWTVIGWVIALIWSIRRDPSSI